MARRATRKPAIISACLAAGVATSALALSGTAASAATVAARPATYAVVAGDTLARISVRFCRTARDYPALAAASHITNPDRIRSGQLIRLACHPLRRPFPPVRVAQRNGSGRAAHTVSTRGMSRFEACVITRESRGHPRAVNRASGAGGLFQFLPSTWARLGYARAYPGGAQTAPVRVQEAAFAKLYAEAGTSPWAPYDGC
jgi:hypothetical protein